MNPEINQYIPQPTPHQPPHVANIPVPDPAHVRSCVTKWIHPKFHNHSVVRDRGKTLVDIDSLSLEMSARMIQHANECVASQSKIHAAEIAKLTEANKRERHHAKDMIDLATKMRHYIGEQRRFVDLAIRVLARAGKSKKKGPANRQARSVLEAALSEPEPGAIAPAWLGVLMGGWLALAGTYLFSKMRS